MKKYNYDKEYKEINSDFRLNKILKKKNKDAVIKKLKMRAGALQDNDYNFNNPDFIQDFLSICRYISQKNLSNEQHNFKVLYKKISELGLILFGVNLEFIKGSYYLPYIYYLFNNTVKFKKIKIVNSNISFENVTFEQLSEEKLNGTPIIILLLDILRDPTKNKFISIKRNEDLWHLINKLNEKIQLSQSPQLQQQRFQPPQLQQQRFQQPFQSQINPIFNITKQNLDNKYNYYRCEDPSLEVKINPDTNIFFGYNENLFKKALDNSYKLYYKYSYRNGIFFELFKKQDEIFEEKQIDINIIPTYDILRLYYAIKQLKNRQELEQKLQTRINILKENISKTGEAFIKLEHSNFDKEKKQIRNLNATENTKKITSSEYKNFGKVKKRRVTEKTYIFFGAKLSQNSSRNLSFFTYVCFREDNNVFYYSKTDLNKKIPLYLFPYIYPLEDLISFILLRRMITNDNTFADIIYKEADSRIKYIKTNKIAQKMLKQEFPENYEIFSYNTIKYSKNYKNRLLKQVSLLPTSQNPVINI